jgi:hypothetical protein
MFYTCEHNFHFSERPVGRDSVIKMKKYTKEEELMFAESVEQMYERECDVSLEPNVYLHLVLMHTLSPSVQIDTDLCSSCISGRCHTEWKCVN